MGWPLDIALYVIVWWLAFFAVLPWGIRPANEGEQGHDAGAPANPRLLRREQDIYTVDGWRGSHRGNVSSAR
jgi:predicted secreted protein